MRRPPQSLRALRPPRLPGPLAPSRAPRRALAHIPPPAWSLAQLSLAAAPSSSGALDSAPSSPALDAAAFEKLQTLAHLQPVAEDAAAVHADLDAIIRCAQTIKTLDLSHLTEAEVYATAATGEDEGAEPGEDEGVEPGAPGAADIVTEGGEADGLLRQAPRRQGNFFSVPLAK